MAIEIFKLFGRILVDDKEAQKSLSSTDKKAKSFGDRLRGGIKTAMKWGAAIVAGATAAATGIAAIATPMVKAAAEMEALNAQFDQVFKDMGDEAQATIDNLGNEFGMLPNRIKPSFTQMTSMFKGLGLDTQEAMKQAETAVTLVADAAAFYDMSFEDANAALNSFIKGNYEGGEAIGLFANETQLAAWAAENLGLDWKNLDEAGKQVARLEYAKAMQEAAGATGQAARESESFENVMGNLRQAWYDFMAEAGKPLLEPVIAGVQRLTEIIQWATENVVPALTGMWDAFREGETVAEGIQNVIDEISSGEGIANIVNMARDGFNNFVSWLASEGFPLLMEGFIQGREMLFNAAMTLFPAIIEAAVEFLPQFLEWIMGTFIPQLIAFILESIPMLIEAGIQLFNSLITAINTVLPMLIEILFNVFLPSLLTTVLGMLPSLLSSGIQLFMSLVNAILTVLPQLLALLVTVVLPNLLSTIISMIPQLLATAIQLFLALLDAVLNVMPQLLALLLTVVLPNILSTLISMMPQLLTTAIQVFMMLLEGLIQMMPQIINFIIFTLIPSIISAFSQLDMIQIGKDIIRGLWNGISSLSGWIREKVSGFISGIGETIKSFFGISSPSKLMMEYGRNITQGLAIGVEDERQRVNRAAEQISREALNFNVTQNVEPIPVEHNRQEKEKTARSPLELHLHAGTLIADKQGLKQLERILRQIRIEEDGRLGVEGV